MATTSIWWVKGWLGKVVIYIENPDKTTNPAFYEKAAMTKTQAQGLSDVIEYAINNEKTQAESDEVLQSFVSGINCYPGTAREEMLAVKKQYGKEDGTVAYHGYQSFAPGEATPEIAHEIGVKLAQRLWGDRYQVIVATHLDHANHLHNHFVLNTVSFVDGLKYHRTGEDYKAMREASDALCREYGLSVIENPQPGKADHYAAWKAKQDGRPTWPGLVRDDVDEAIRQSMTMQQFWSNLKKRGYEVKVKKLLYLKPRLFCDGDHGAHPQPTDKGKAFAGAGTLCPACSDQGQYQGGQKSYRLPRLIFSLLLSAGFLSEGQAPAEQTPPFSSPRGPAENGRHIRRSKAAGPLSDRHRRAAFFV